MSVSAFGINHHSAPINIRERIAFNDSITTEALTSLMEYTGVSEAVLLSTCNRTEIYTVSKQNSSIQDWLINHRELQDIDLTSFSYQLTGISAVRHLMRVAAGLDSMVIGEPQIFGQIKNAFKLACEYGTVGPYLNQLFPIVFATSKHVRSETNIGRCPVSIAYAVVSLCKKLFNPLSESNALLVGAGTTIELVATYLKQNNINEIYIANRSLERAHELADQFDAHAIRIGDIPHYLNKVNIIITATASQLPILGKGLFERQARQQQNTPLFIADLAVPRDVEPEVGELPHIQLYNIDNLREVIQKNVNDRLLAVEQAEAMIEMYAANYMRQLRINEASDMIRHYRNTMLQHRDIELEKALSAMQAGKNPEAVLKNFARNFVNKAIHNPTIVLRDAASDGRLNLLALAKELFK